MLKRNKYFLFMLFALTFPFALAGCSSDSGEASYEQISGEEAKALMDSESGYIIIDAREQYEYDKGTSPERFSFLMAKLLTALKQSFPTRIS